MSRSRIVIIFLCALYSAVLWANFTFSDSVVYAYTGLHYNPPPLAYTVLGILMAMLPALWMPVALTRPSFICYWWLYVSLLVPSMLVPFHVLDADPAQVVKLCAAMLGCFALLGASHLFPAIRLRSVTVDERVLYLGMLIPLIAIVVLITAQRGLNFSLSISDMVTRRLATRETMLGGSLFAYAYATVRSSVVPILLARGITRNSAFWTGVGLFGAIVCFSLSAERTTFFTPLYLILLSVLVSRFRNSFGAWYLAGVTAAVLCCMSEYLLFQGSVLSTYISRRLLLVPSHVTACYFEYYSLHDFTYYSESLLKWIVEPRQALPTSYMIGETYFGSDEVNCTGNIWATGYSEFGFSGMLITTALLGVLFRTMDGVVTSKNFSEGCLIAGLMGMSWSEVSLFTSLLSNGVVSSIFLLSLHPAASRKRQRTGAPFGGRKTLLPSAGRRQQALSMGDPGS